jgi:phenylacetate-CoA ligase
MDPITENRLEIVRQTATRVPAYQVLLREAGLRAEEIKSAADFTRLPILEKKNTFQRFPLEQLCVDGKLGRLGSVLTSSGHSGIFAFGLTAADALSETAEWIDGLLDYLFQVRTKETLLINCLPMGVKVPTTACTLAETSVRADMVLGLVRAFGTHFSQMIFVGEAAFVKHVLESGRKSGIDWKNHLVQVIVGEEPLAENARKYLEQLLFIDPRTTDKGMVISSMGVAELGLNLFSDAPPALVIVSLRRLLHENAELRNAVLGPCDSVPSLFTYDPRRIFVEFDSTGRLLVTTLDPRLRLPLIRYATGDQGSFVRLPSTLQPALEANGLSWETLQALPIVAIQGRGAFVLAGQARVYPEAVKEGLYANTDLVESTTANFRLTSGQTHARVRIQLAPGVAPDPQLIKAFAAALSRYVHAPLEVTAETYESFGSGMALDYERKFNYLEHENSAPLSGPLTR